MSPQEKFLASMSIGYEQWHDGIGYDLEALDDIASPEKDEIVKMLSVRSPLTWRELEALAHIGTGEAQRAILLAQEDPSPEVKIAAARYVAGNNPAKTAALVDALQRSQFYGGLGRAIDLAAEYHPPAVVDTLFQGVLRRDGQAAVNFAALLFYIYGLAEEPFDWDHRPFFLRFDEADPAMRAAAFQELCARVGVPPERYLA